MKIGIGLYGVNGHQIDNRISALPNASLVGVADFPEDRIERLPDAQDVRRYATLEEMLADPDIQLVSLCSPRRADQAEEAIRCMEAGKHVYAEKPSALTEREFDRIVATSERTGRIYHEQAATAFEQPYLTLKKIVQSGLLGTIVQVYTQKSYPWHDRRPQNEDIDGGLTTQVGVYNARFVEHVASVPIRSMLIHETQLGNPIREGECRLATSFLMELENRGTAVGVANYLCSHPQFWGHWGYETVRIWGTEGFIESIDGGRIGTIALNSEPARPLSFEEAGENYLAMFLQEITTGQRVIPFTLAEELSPTRHVVRARERMRYEYK